MKIELDDILNRVKFSRREYKEYLENDIQWKKLKKKVAERDKNCLICDKNKVKDVHHLCYKQIDNVTINDLIGICRSCHSKIHKSIYLSNKTNLVVLKKVIINHIWF